MSGHRMRRVVANQGGGAVYPWTRHFEDDVSDVISNQTSGTATITQDGGIYKVGSKSLKIIRTSTTGTRDGAHILLPKALDRSQTITVSCWLYQKTTPVSPEIRICNSSLAGYAFNHDGSILYACIRSNRNTTTNYTQVGVGLLANNWYRSEVIVTPTGYLAKQYDSANTLLATTPTGSDTSITAFDRIYFCGYYLNETFYWDDLTVSLS